MRFFIFPLFALLMAQSAMGFQNTPPVATINGATIGQGEFMYAFKKNRKENIPLAYDSLEKYLNTYINFKLKVNEARKSGIDTTKAFLQEYNGYISQVQKPYLQNPQSEEDLILETYNRMKYEVNASHILIKVANPSNPQDTLVAFQKIDSLRNLAVNGASFETLAKQNSQDGSAKNGGELGWFSALSMVYPFETGAYETPVGGISKIVKSQFGYHLIKVNDKRETRGKVKTSHIFLTKNQHSRESGNALIKAIYDSIQQGGSWKELCLRYSEDVQTKKNSGGLPFFGTGQLPEEYLAKAYTLDHKDQISEPLETSYGWHIIRLDDKQEFPPIEMLRDEIEDGVRRSGRNQLNSEDLIKKLKNENGFTLDLPNLEKIIDQISSVGLPNINLEEVGSNTIFKMGDKEVHYAEFFSYLGNANQLSHDALWSRFKTFEKDQILAYEDSIAPQKYPDYGFILNEYKEGLMLFEIMESEVWNKAAEDSTGLNQFFAQNQQKYPAPERALVWVIESPDTMALKKVETDFHWNLTKDFKTSLQEQVDPQVFNKLKIAKRTYERDDLPIFAQNWKNNVLLPQPAEQRIYAIEEVIEAGNYRLEEVKGIVISDYQDALEKAWVKKLRHNNKVKINKKALKQLASNEKG